MNDNEIIQLEKELREAVRCGELTEEQAEEVYEREVKHINNE